MLAASASSRTTSIRIASRVGSAGRAPAVSRMIREPNRLPTAATPMPAIAAMTATVSAVVARKVRLAVMTSAVAATIPTRVMTMRMLFRRLAAACAQNVRPFARRVPIDAIANVTMGRTMTTTARSHGRRSRPCPSAIERQTARPRLAIPTTTPADRTIAIANATAAPIRAIQSGRAGGLIRGGRHAQPDQCDRRPRPARPARRSRSAGRRRSRRASRR